MSIFEQADKLKNTLDGFRPLEPYILKNLVEDLIIRWTYHSNAIYIYPLLAPGIVYNTSYPDVSHMSTIHNLPDQHIAGISGTNDHDIDFSPLITDLMKIGPCKTIGESGKNCQYQLDCKIKQKETSFEDLLTVGAYFEKDYQSMDRYLVSQIGTVLKRAGFGIYPLPE